MLVSEVTMELILWEMAGDTFFSQLPSSLSTHSHCFYYWFSSTKWPKIEAAGQTRAGNFQREIVLPGIFQVPRYGTNRCSPEMQCVSVLEGCSHHVYSFLPTSPPPSPPLPKERHKKAERARRAKEHTA